MLTSAPTIVHFVTLQNMNGRPVVSMTFEAQLMAVEVRVRVDTSLNGLIAVA
jgi:hypothetical protein